MKRIEVSAYLIIAFLLLTASQATRIGQAMETVDDDMKMIRFRTEKPKPTANSADRLLLATWKEPGKQFNGNMRKVPSAPNPIGNRHPPSKP